MEFSVKSGSPEKQRSACIVVGVFEPRRLSPSPNNSIKSATATSAPCCVAASWKANLARRYCCTMCRTFCLSAFC